MHKQHLLMLLSKGTFCACIIFVQMWFRRNTQAFPQRHSMHFKSKTHSTESWLHPWTLQKLGTVPSLYHFSLANNRYCFSIHNIHWKEFLRDDANKTKLFTFLVKHIGCLVTIKQTITMTGSEVVCIPPQDTNHLAPCDN